MRHGHYYNLFNIDNFENLYLEIKNHCLFYAEFMNDIFIIYIGGEAKLINFQTNVNMMHDATKFDHEMFTHPITFLDAQVYIDKNRQLQILLTKPTNTYNYLDNRSPPPQSKKTAFPTHKWLDRK